jgi:hypothetical protein
MKILWMILLSGLVLAPLTYAEDYRLEKPFGLYAGLLSDPIGSYVGLNAAYNLTNYLRVTGGVGYSEGAYTGLQQTNGLYSDQLVLTSNFVIGAGVKVLLPHEEFSPAVGLSVSNLIDPNYNGLDQTENILFVNSNVGFDYQAKDGFDLGVDVSFPLAMVSGQTEYVFFLLPGVNIGKFF